MLHKCEEIQKKFTETFQKLSGILTETFRKFSSLFILHSVSHMHRTPMGCLGLTFSYMQCSNMRHKCEEIQKKFTEIFRKLSGNFLFSNTPITFSQFWDSVAYNASFKISNNSIFSDIHHFTSHTKLTYIKIQVK
jgi:hypothetical protein